MTKKIVFGVAVVALAVLVMAPAASAACGSVRTAATYNSATQLFNYWHSPSGDATGTLIGETWQLGAPASFSTGNCNLVDAGLGFPGFLYFGAGGIGLNLHMESCGNGCPAPLSTLAVLAQKADPSGVADFLLATVAETPGVVNFDYSQQGNHNMIHVPTPVVTASSGGGGNVNLTVHVPSIAGGLYGPNAANGVTGYKILTALSVANPGNLAIAYTGPSFTVAGAGGAQSADTPFTLTCPTVGGADQWVATQLSFEGGAILSDVVSAPRRVHCAGAIANPKYTPVPKKTVGTPIQK